MRPAWLLHSLAPLALHACSTGEAARLHLAACSEAFLRGEASGYSGGPLDVAALEEQAAAAVAEKKAPAANGAAGHDGAQQQQQDGGEWPRQRSKGGEGGGALRRVNSSLKNLLADRPSSTLDRSQTGLAAAAKGASRWGASYWTQVRRAVGRA